MPPVGDGYSSISDEYFNGLVTSGIDIQTAGQWLYNVKKFTRQSSDDLDTTYYHTAIDPFIGPTATISDHKKNPQLRFYEPDEPQQYLRASAYNTLVYSQSDDPNSIFGGNATSYLDIFYFVKKQTNWYVGTLFAATISANLNTIQTTFSVGEATTTITYTITDTFYP